jgi:hypothetical protein
MANLGDSTFLDGDGQSVPEYELMIIWNIFNGNGDSSISSRGFPFLNRVDGNI